MKYTVCGGRDSCEGRRPICTDRPSHRGGALGAHVVVARPLLAAEPHSGQAPGPA